MRSPKRFSTFLSWTLVIFEAVSLSLVLGVLYTLLSRTIESEFLHRAEARQVETSMALNDRIELLRNQLHDIVTNNTIRVSLMLGVKSQVLETLKAKYTASNGAHFFVREAGQSEFLPPLPLQFMSIKQHLLWLRKITPHKPIRFQRIQNGHYVAIFSRPIKKRLEELGTAYLIYDLTSDMSFSSYMKLFPHSSLLVLEKGRLVNPCTSQEELVLNNPEAIISSHAENVGGKFVIPLKGFPGFFYSVSSEPLSKEKRSLMVLLLVLCAGVFSITVAVSFILAKRVSRPLEDIAKQALEISKNPIKPSIDEKRAGHLEFRNLVKAFNELLAALVEAREKLRQKAKEKLQESEERYRKTFEASPYSITISTLNEDRLLDVNDAFCKTSGYTKEEVIGRSGVELKLWDDIEDRDIIVQRLREGEQITNREIKFRRKNGENFIALLSARRLNYRGQECMVSLVTDITEQKKAQKERERLEAQLRQAQKMEAVGTLAGGVAHDFRNILQAIFGYCDILMLDLREGEKGYEEIGEIQKAASRASELTQQLLTFSRKVESKLRPVDLNHQIRQAYKLLGRTLPKTISIDLQLKEKIQKINADPAQIEQVLLNLAINAKDAMPEGGRLIIETEETFLDDDYCKSHAGARPGEYILLTVTDTGHGMDEETLEHIFEPFYTTKGRGKGTGLGLAMVYGIVKGHGGYIVCYSKPGEGTSFEIYLPVIEQNEPIINQEKKSKDKVPVGRGEKVLVIDDDQAILDIVEKTLSKFGYVVLTATDGRQGLQVYAQVWNTIDVVILDYMMPEINGIETLKEIRKIHPTAKIILASGYPLTKAHEEVIRDNVRGFLTKPFNIEEMLRQVRQIIDSP